MTDVTTGSDRIEQRSDLDTGEAGVFSYWMSQDKIAEKEERRWAKRSRDIVKRYRDERPENNTTEHRFNILWSNVQTLIPTLYARTPKPDVERRFKDEDPVGRYAAMLMERCLSYSTDSVDTFDFDSVMKSVVQDRLLPGRGVARVLYVPTFGDEIKSEPEGDAQAQGSVVDNEGDEGVKRRDDPEPLREVTNEEAIAQYVFWEDYREGAARQWCEVPWVRYRSYMTRAELTKRFGKKKGKQVNLDFTPKGMSGEGEKDSPPPDLYKKAIVLEFWDKSKKQAVWIAPGTPDVVLDTKDDPLKLPGFFPNPDPLLSTTTNDKRIPVPDYVEYQDQARELDKLTARIDKLTEALKVSGVYAGEEKQLLQQLIDGGTENKLIPVLDWMAFSDKGGLSKMIEWVPIQQIAETLIQLYNARDRVKVLLYEITGLSDILRGETNPNETFGAQELKANFATRRISPQQKDVAKFARDLLRLMGAVIAEHFSPRTISMITGYPQLDPVPPIPPRPPMPMMMQMNGLAAPSATNGAGVPIPPPGGAPAPPPDPAMQAYQQAMAQWQQAIQQAQAITAKNQEKQQQFDQAVALIKADGAHGFRIEIEADSTIAPDEQAEKQSRVEFMQQFIPFLQQVVPIAQGNPPMADLARELTMFTMRAFKTARPLEEIVGKAFDAIAKMPQNPKATGQDGKAAPEQPGTDPVAVADLALRAKESETTAQTDRAADEAKIVIAREANAVKVATAAAQERAQMAELGEKARQHQIDTALELENIDVKRDAADAKREADQARSASRLT